nr:MAG TPA: hypothetical protein [Caudoviricetes sp.]
MKMSQGMDASHCGPGSKPARHGLKIICFFR